jgi:dihydrofolate reductase
VSKLIYLISTSLDGYVADQHGNLDWTAPDEEVHAFINDALRDVRTFLFGRRVYEVMTVWDGIRRGQGHAPVMEEFADTWHAADKIVYSTTLESVSTVKTRLERSFDADAVRKLKEESAHDLDIGGPELAAQAFAAGLIDEYLVFIHPLILGGGKPALSTEARLRFELFDQRRFANGVAHLHYRYVSGAR